MDLQMSIQALVFTSLGYKPRSGITGSYNNFIFWGPAILFSVEAALFYFPTSNVQAFQFLCILANTCYFLLFFYNSHWKGCEVSVLFLQRCISKYIQYRKDCLKDWLQIKRVLIEWQAVHDFFIVFLLYSLSLSLSFFPLYSSCIIRVIKKIWISKSSSISSEVEGTSSLPLAVDFGLDAALVTLSHSSWGCPWVLQRLRPSCQCPGKQTRAPWQWIRLQWLL